MLPNGGDHMDVGVSSLRPPTHVLRVPQPEGDTAMAMDHAVETKRRIF
jgi:hypothetical protein